LFSLQTQLQNAADAVTARRSVDPEYLEHRVLIEPPEITGDSTASGPSRPCRLSSRSKRLVTSAQASAASA
jgi:hypothetical protein